MTDGARCTEPVVVVGLGAVGAATCRVLARRGVPAVGLDRFGRAHDRGSHHGHTRVFRHAYFEHPDYVPLLLRSTDAFLALEAEAGVALIDRCGVLLVGPPGSALLSASARSANRWGLPVERLDSEALARRFPQFAVGEGTWALWEPGGGFVRPEAAIRAALSVAERAGAELRTDARVVRLVEESGGVTVHLQDGGEVRGRAAIVAAGAYTAQLVPDLSPWLRVTRERQAWIEPSAPADAAPERLPAWLVDRGDRPAVYGIPVDPRRAGPPRAKVALHGGGAVADPEDADRELSLAERELLAAAASEVLPGLPGRLAEAKACLYTNMPDEHFLVDRAPGCRRTWVAAGLSGHGFKLSPALGEALADLATTGETASPVGFLRLSRPGLRATHDGH